MKLQTLLIAILLAASLSSCSQAKKATLCDISIDTLYNQYGKHLVFYCYYTDSINKNTRADTIYHNYLSYYRDGGMTEDTNRQDKQLLRNLKLYLCKDARLDTSAIVKWCNASRQLGVMMVITEFTIDGYMNFLFSQSNTAELLEGYLTPGRTPDSLSSNEMDNIYFASITLIASMKTEEQRLFFEKLKHWEFL